MATPASFESFQQELSRLVSTFERHFLHVTSPDYNEATLRAEYLDPLFAALGWDVGNRKGLIHTEREVDIEVRTAVSGKQTRADYVFRIVRIERFTCEAKKPYEKLHTGHAYQAKRDAYARGIPFAILSDFEELKFYVVGSRPTRDDPHTGEYKSLHYSQYNVSARELWDLLAYENVTAGSIDRLIEALPKRPVRLKGKQGYLIRPDRTKSLDADFLNFLDDSRQKLGSDLLKHNDRADLLEGNRLNEAAQRILDRLVFLRICEDRGIDTGTLLATQLGHWMHEQSAPPRLRRGSIQERLKLDRSGEVLAEEPPSPRYAPPAEGGLYRALVFHIRALDQRPPSYQPFFNGQLFKAHFSEELVVGDEWLANFLDDLTDDDSGYNFADIKVEILGSAYERFLGKVLRPQGRGATIEEKPEVRKAGGVYYTPRYIVDYIVEQTVGRQLEGKSLKEAAQLRFLDPACGSGSFLIRVYERVMEHHLRTFNDRVAEVRHGLEPQPAAAVHKLLTRHKDEFYLDAAGNVRLTTRLKRQILQNNVFGVDIDAQAVEVTQLSLYLKMLEGENRESIYVQTKDLFNKVALLPPLDQNIKCGNSLIASDFSLEAAELVRVNAFDWDIGFEKIMAKGGFDAVVGNPPYVRQESIKDQKAYFQSHYASYEGTADLFIYFIELGTRLMKPGGTYSIIVSSSLLRSAYAEPLRRHLRETVAIEQIVDFGGLAVFVDAKDTYVCIPVLAKKPQPPAVRVARIASLEFDRLAPLVQAGGYDVAQRHFTPFAWSLKTEAEAQLFEKLCRVGSPLGEVLKGRIFFGIKSGLNEAFEITTEQRALILKGHPKTSRLIKPFVGGQNVRRYEIESQGRHLIVIPCGWTRAQLGKPGAGERPHWDWFSAEHPTLAAHLAAFETAARKRQDQGDFWWELRSCDYYAALDTPKIIFPDIAKSPRFYPDNEGLYLSNTAYCLGTGDRALAGILNSRLCWFAISNIAIPFGVRAGEYRYRLFYQYMEKVPIRLPDPKSEKALNDKLVASVDRMLTLTPSLGSAKSDTERAALQNAIQKTDRDIDKLVYDLYGLTPEEIALVEGVADAPAETALEA
jgi:hypothetical protein